MADKIQIKIPKADDDFSSDDNELLMNQIISKKFTKSQQKDILDVVQSVKHHKNDSKKSKNKTQNSQH